MTKKKVLMVCILFIIATCLSLLLYFKFFVDGVKSIKDIDQSEVITISKEEAKEDGFNLIKHLEQIHPIFIDGSNLDEYNKAKNDYIQKLEQYEDNITVDTFLIDSRIFLSYFKDGHTQILYLDDFGLEKYSYYTDDGKFAVLDVNNNEHIIKEISGISVDEVVALVEQTIPKENDIYIKKLANTLLLREEYINYLGGDYENIVITTADGAELRKDDLQPIMEEGNDGVTKTEIIDNYFVFSLADFGGGPEYEAGLLHLEESIENGFKKVIIDLRNNGGGNSRYGDRIFEVLGYGNNDLSNMGSISRISTYVFKQRNFLETVANFFVGEYKPNVKKPNNSGIELYFITNENTFSSAKMMSLIAKDSKIGKLYGTPPSNSPSAYGDILSFQLENTNLYYMVSYKKWLRPDVNANQDILEVDVYIENINEMSIEDIINEFNK